MIMKDFSTAIGVTVYSITSFMNAESTHIDGYRGEIVLNGVIITCVWNKRGVLMYYAYHKGWRNYLNTKLIRRHPEMFQLVSTAYTLITEVKTENGEDAFLLNEL